MAEVQQVGFPAQQPDAGIEPTGPGTTGATARPARVVVISVIVFAAGLVNLAHGLAALLDGAFYSPTPAGLAAGTDHTVWGITLLALGVTLSACGYGVLAGRRWARTGGIPCAAVNALVTLGFIAAYPRWTLLVVAFDVIALCALLVHDGEPAPLRDGGRS